MDKGTYRDNYQEVISMEEYLLRRQRIREAGRKNQQSDVVENSPAWFMAELYIYPTYIRILKKELHGTICAALLQINKVKTLKKVLNGI